MAHISPSVSSTNASRKRPYTEEVDLSVPPKRAEETAPHLQIQSVTNTSFFPESSPASFSQIGQENELEQLLDSSLRGLCFTQQNQNRVSFEKEVPHLYYQQGMSDGETGGFFTEEIENKIRKICIDQSHLAETEKSNDARRYNESCVLNRGHSFSSFAIFQTPERPELIEDDDADEIRTGIKTEVVDDLEKLQNTQKIYFPSTSAASLLNTSSTCSVSSSQPLRNELKHLLTSPSPSARVLPTSSSINLLTTTTNERFEVTIKNMSVIGVNRIFKFHFRPERCSFTLASAKTVVLFEMKKIISAGEDEMSFIYTKDIKHFKRNHATLFVIVPLCDSPKEGDWALKFILSDEEDKKYIFESKFRIKGDGVAPI